MLVCEKLCKTFQSRVPVHALKSASMHVATGELVAITGKSGSGKSTLLSLLGLLDRPDSGYLRISNTIASELSAREADRTRGENIGFVFQSFHLAPSLTTSENVALGLRYAGICKREWSQRVKESLESVGLSRRTHSLVSNLSGGEAQRVALARAIAKRPRIILADEPTGNLDSYNENIVMKILRDYANNGTAVAVVTHNIEIASRADRQYHVNDGFCGEISQ